MFSGGGYNQGSSGHGHQSLGGDAGDYTEDGEVIPQFAEPVQNITVPRGRDAKIACVIDNLGDFRVRITMHTNLSITIIKNQLDTCYQPEIMKEYIYKQLHWTTNKQTK